MRNCGCGCNASQKGGPFSKGKELVEFVYNAHGGAIRNQPIGGDGLEADCQGCGASFKLKTFVGECPECHGVHAVAPMNPIAEAIQFAGKGYALPK